MDIKNLLDEKAKLYNNISFIKTDPIQVPHQFVVKEDIEIAALLTATIAWGNRTSIIKNAYTLMQLMDNAPYQFTLNATENDLKPINNFVHRTFNGSDCIGFIKSLQHIYSKHKGLEQVFNQGYQIDLTIYSAIKHFRAIFFEIPQPTRLNKHVSDVTANSAAKRINMFLRWMVRNDKAGVDFGLWKHISPSALHLPLDLHTGNIARQLGLLQRTQNDWKAVSEITHILRKFDPADPIKYDFALFGMGAFE